MWHQHPRCSSKMHNTDITLFLFLSSVKHVSALHCATKRRQFRRLWGGAECSRLTRYTNLSGAESEGTPTNRFLRTGHSLRGAARSPAARSPASSGRGVRRRPELFPSPVHPYGAHTQKRRWSHSGGFAANVFRESSCSQDNCQSSAVCVKEAALQPWKDSKTLIKIQDSKCTSFHHSSFLHGTPGIISLSLSLAL